LHYARGGIFASASIFCEVNIMNINSLKRCAMLGAILIGVGLSLPVAAQSHGGSGAHSGGSVHAGGPHSGAGGWHGGGWRGGGPHWWGVGLGWDAWYFGYPYFGYPYPGYYYPYAPPTVVVAPTTQPEATEAPQNPPPVANWYYCASTKTYYPYVRQCAEAWQVVPATPPGSVR